MEIGASSQRVADARKTNRIVGSNEFRACGYEDHQEVKTPELPDYVVQLKAHKTEYRLVALCSDQQFLPQQPFVTFHLRAHIVDEFGTLPAPINRRQPVPVVKILRSRMRPVGRANRNGRNFALIAWRLVSKLNIAIHRELIF